MDPAGLTLGATSLAISVCGGIIKYTESWKAQDQDVKSVRSAAEQLRNLLEEVENRIQTAQASFSSQAAAKLNGCLLACQENIDSLVKLSEKYTPPSTSGLAVNTKHQLRKLAYPFTKNTLFGLRDHLEKLHRNVDTALHILTIDLGNEHGQNIIGEIDSLKISQQTGTQDILRGILESESRVGSLFSKDLNRNLSELQLNVSSEIDASSRPLGIQLTSLATRDIPGLQERMVQSIESTGQDVKAEVHCIDQNVNLLRMELQQQHQNLYELMAREFKLLQIEHNLSKSDEPPVSGFEDCVSEVIATPNRAKKLQYGKRNLVALPRHPNCTCSMMKIANCYSRQTSRSYYVTSDICVIHDKDCMVSYKSRGTRTHKLNISVGQFLVTGAVSILYSPFHWIKGWNISPHLSFRATVSNDSPAFNIVDCFFRRFERRARGCDLKHYVYHCNCHYAKYRQILQRETNECIKELATTFRNGESSPYDVDSKGQNLLHRVCSKYRCIHYLSRVSSMLRSLLHFLTIEEVNWEEHDIHNETPFNYLFFGILGGLKADENLEEILRFGAARSYISSVSYSMTSSWIYKSMHQFLSSSVHKKLIMEAMDCGQLSMTTITSSQADFEAMLANSCKPSSVEENPLHYTPFHLAVSRPDRLRLLLQQSRLEINSVDIFGFSALDHAIMSTKTESAKLLSDSGAILSFNWIQNRFCSAQDHRYSYMEIFISETFQRSRLQLRDIGLLNLTEKVTKELGLDSDTLPDVHSREILHQLLNQGIDVPASVKELCSNPGSVYHAQLLEHNGLLQHLFEAGFKDVDSAWRGITPLMVQWGVSPSYWAEAHAPVSFFIANGARLDRVIPPELIEDSDKEIFFPKRNCQAIHKLAASSGAVFRQDRFMPERDPNDWFWELLKGKAKDISQCKCSDNGCSALSILIRTIGPHSLRCQCKRDGCNKLVISFMQKLSSKYSDQDFQDGIYETAATLLRSLTFSELELTHTCCEYVVEYSLEDYPKPMVLMKSPEEISEIQDEERDLIRQLDSVVEELTQTFKEKRMPLYEFLLEYWWPRMDSLDESEILTEVEIAQMRGIGVEFNVDGESDDKNLYSNKIHPEERCKVCHKPISPWQHAHLRQSKV